MQCVMYSVQ